MKRPFFKSSYAEGYSDALNDMKGFIECLEDRLKNAYIRHHEPK